ncbi:MAG TPA: hypothetical protein VFS13_16115, partial [Steroidobacteraceae bacterium]|nr:hypothetical protein [Steroidobacteraceae bacterium]
GAYRDAGTGRRVVSFNSIDVAGNYLLPSASGPLSNTSVELSVSNLLSSAPPFIDREAGYDVSNAVPFGRVATVILRKRW